MTGSQGGFRLSRGNLASAAVAIGALLDLGPGDLVLSCLPGSDVAQRAIGHACLGGGAALAHSARPEALLRDLGELRPTVGFVGSGTLPSLGEQIRAAVRVEPRPRRWLFRWALARGRARAGADLAQGRLPGARPWWFRLADALVLRRIREMTGGRLRLLVSLGVLPDAEECGFFLAAGLPLLHGLSLPEASGLVALNAPAAVRPGSAGRPVPGVEVRIAGDGRILLKGRSVTSTEADPEGWVRTGCRGRIDTDGYLWVPNP